MSVASLVLSVNEPITAAWFLIVLQERTFRVCCEGVFTTETERGKLQPKQQSLFHHSSQSSEFFFDRCG